MTRSLAATSSPSSAGTPNLAARAGRLFCPGGNSLSSFCAASERGDLGNLNDSDPLDARSPRARSRLPTSIVGWPGAVRVRRVADVPDLIVRAGRAARTHRALARKPRAVAPRVLHFVRMRRQVGQVPAKMPGRHLAGRAGDDASLALVAS